MHFLTYTTGGYTHFTENLLINFEKVLARHSHHMTVVCVDEQAMNNLAKYKSKPWLTIKLTTINTFANFANFGSSEFNKITQFKVQLIRAMLPQYDELYFVDSDIVFFKDPQPRINATPGDLVFQQDAPWNHHKSLYATYVCSGNFVLRNNLKTINFLDKWIEMCKQQPHLNEQGVISEYFKSKVSDVRYITEVDINIFPMDEFQNGWDAFQGGWNTINEKVCIHANHRVGSEAKISALKSINMWFIS